MEFQEPVLLIGIGGAGAKLATRASSLTGADCVIISHDSNDLNSENDIKIHTESYVNPSSYLIRAQAQKAMDKIRGKIFDYSSVIIFANLAGRAGCAISPLVASAAKEEGKKVLSFAIMPFGFEKERVFLSGVSLKRLRASCDSTVVIDNDALLESNPDLTMSKCYEITHHAVMYVATSLQKSSISNGLNILSTSKDVSDVEVSLRDSIKMLYEDAPPASVRKTMLYVFGSDNVSVGKINAIAKTVSGIFNENNTSVSLATTQGNKAQVVMITSVEGLGKFESYDPLGMIPQESTLDWDTPESSIKTGIELYQLE
ncbi:cell division protein FtsZ [Candidatus Nitrosotenuis chungbukensis]|uniref:cell division protein FtsZ n=1 Tax=Candidatus Nitrosotenuis chungbukensis TaxID=1353246 RepID=UPI0026721F60|nr:cell division protein FtsZ [Candidatus Nitrosotenuis chungbukensis]WKT57894.1 cell division protein FtsZ [Candidatus Nitrosotenuis chungbukensis]